MPSVHRILSPVIFYGLLATIVLTAIPYGTVQPLWIALFECLVFSLGLLGVLDFFLTRSSLPPAASLALPLLVLCLFILFQSLPLFESSNSVISNVRFSISADRFSTLQLSIKLFALVVAGVLLLQYAQTEKRLRAIIYVVIGVGVASALLGIMRQGGSSGPSWFFPLPPDGRGFAQFVNRNHFGFLAEMSLGLTLGMLVRGSEGLQRYLVFLPITLFLWVALIVSNTRGGILASLCQLLFLGVLLNPVRHLAHADAGTFGERFQKIAARAVSVISALVLIVAFFYGVSWIGGERVTSNLELASTAYDQPGIDLRENTRRKQIWSSTWELFKAHPVLGSGLGGYWIAITRYHDASGASTPQEAHNDYLELLASGGLAGSALALWFVISLARHARRNISSAPRFSGAVALGALVGIFGVMIHSFVDFGLHVTSNALVFTTLIALLVHNSTPEDFDHWARNAGQNSIDIY